MRPLLYRSLQPDVYFISGTGRSGTTWLGEMLAELEAASFLFEPYHEKELFQQYDHDHEKFLESLIHNNISNEWIYRHNTRRFPKNIVLKTIRTNLIMDKLLDLFPTFKYLHIIRDPLSVAQSMHRLGWWKNSFSYFLRTHRNDLKKLGLLQLLPNSLSDLSEMEEYVYWWCLENFAVLNLESEYLEKILVVEYKKMRELDYLQKKLSQIGIQDNPKKLISLMNKNSKLTHKNSNRKKYVFSGIERKKLFDVVSSFGLEEYYE